MSLSISIGTVLGLLLLLAYSAAIAAEGIAFHARSYCHPLFEVWRAQSGVAHFTIHAIVWDSTHLMVTQEVMDLADSKVAVDVSVAFCWTQP